MNQLNIERLIGSKLDSITPPWASQRKARLNKIKEAIRSGKFPKNNLKKERYLGSDRNTKKRLKLII